MYLTFISGETAIATSVPLYSLKRPNNHQGQPL